jgi:outer membrane lipoprotein-sorting protein
MRRSVCLLIFLLLFSVALQAQTEDLLTHIWSGMQQAQTKYTTLCGTVTETRSSKLMVKPMVLTGRFCSEGNNRFMIEYSAPHAMKIVLNDTHLSITMAGQSDQASDIGDEIHRVQSAFGGGNSIESLEKEFTVTAAEKGSEYELKLLPRSMRLRHRLNYLVVKLSKRDFLPRTLEVDGKSGVHSLYAFEITSQNTKLPDDTFEVKKSK